MNHTLPDFLAIFMFFPTYNSTNYWADVVFNTSPGLIETESNWTSSGRRS